MTGPAPGFYERDGLHVECYDALHEETFRDTPSLREDVAWYAAKARGTGGPVLEIASGTGRVTWPLAAAGFEVVGLDRSEGMLRRAEEKRAAKPPEVAARARFVRGDMAAFDLGREFPLLLVPFRSFQSLRSPEEQKRALGCFRRHLRPGGTLVIDLFDPRLEFLLPEGATPWSPPRVFRNPGTGLDVTVAFSDRRNDPVRQVLSETWTFTERDAAGGVVRRESEVLTMRWTYRHEMRHLLALCGFEVEAEFSDFRGSPPAYGGAQLWVARRP